MVSDANVSIHNRSCWKHQMNGYTYWVISPAILNFCLPHKWSQLPNERICFPAMERICSLQNKIFRINKSILEDFATQGSEQEVVNAGSFINGSKTQRCTATVPSLHTVSFNIESNSTRKEVAPIVHMRTKQWKHKIRERRNGNLPSQRQYLDCYLSESSGHFIFKAEFKPFN